MAAELPDWLSGFLSKALSVEAALVALIFSSAAFFAPSEWLRFISLESWRENSGSAVAVGFLFLFSAARVLVSFAYSLSECAAIWLRKIRQTYEKDREFRALKRSLQFLDETEKLVLIELILWGQHRIQRNQADPGVVGLTQKGLIIAGQSRFRTGSLEYSTSDQVRAYVMQNEHLVRLPEKAWPSAMHSRYKTLRHDRVRYQK